MNTVLDRRHVVVVVRTLSVLVVASGVTWLALPSPIGSLAWIPSPAPALDGAYQTNGLLTAAEHIYTDVVTGPEDIAFDHEGRASTGLSDGRIVRLNADGTVTDLAHTGGRPLGLEYAPDGTLYVADARRGLLRVDLATRAVTVLLDKAEGIAFHCVNDLEIAKDGTLYFSDSSAVWGLDQATEDILDQRPSGRVLKYDPRTDSDALVLARDLVFANGLALSLDEKQLFIAETGRYRIWRLWLSGDKKKPQRGGHREPAGLSRQPGHDPAGHHLGRLDLHAQARDRLDAALPLFERRHRLAAQVAAPRATVVGVRGRARQQRSAPAVFARSRWKKSSTRQCGQRARRSTLVGQPRR